MIQVLRQQNQELLQKYWGMKYKMWNLQKLQQNIYIQTGPEISYDHSREAKQPFNTVLQFLIKYESSYFRLASSNDFLLLCYGMLSIADVYKIYKANKNTEWILQWKLSPLNDVLNFHCKILCNTFVVFLCCVLQHQIIFGWHSNGARTENCSNIKLFARLKHLNASNFFHSWENTALKN